MEFIGRDAEMNLLEGCYQNKSSFIGVIYGRRRIGKSRLLSEFIQKKIICGLKALRMLQQKCKSHIFRSNWQDKQEIRSCSKVRFQIGIEPLIF